MRDALNHSRIPTLAEVDLVVIGAGSAGCCAAIAAAEAGLRTLLVERYGFPGGTSTAVLDTFYGFFTPGPQPRKVVGGIPSRVVDALAARDAIYLRPNTYGAGTGVTYNPEVLKSVWDDLLTSAGVDLLLHTTLLDAETDSTGRLTAVILLTRNGIHRINAHRFIDASGDAELCHLAHIPYESAGALEPAQTLTTTFRLANVDFPRFHAAGGKKRLAEIMADVDLARHPLPRRKGSFHAMAIPGLASTVAARIAYTDVSDSRSLTRAEIEGRRQAFIYERFARDLVPGFENARISGLSTFTGIRESRRVYGHYRLTRGDCLSVARFDDRVLLCGAPIEDHRAGPDGADETAWAYIPGDAAYDVPYRTLVPKDRAELWVVGRCFSATHDAHASCRSMAQTMAMGHAAGLAASISLRNNISALDVNIPELQQQLRAAGAVLETPNQVAHTAADAWKSLKP
jgi:hypothetical protein